MGTQLKSVAVVATGLLMALSAPAALIDRGGGLLYDDVLRITWLSDWNYASTSGYDSGGAMQWSRAKAWAENLVYGGFDDWRLPTAPAGCLISPPAYECAGNEMGHMYYKNLGAREGGRMLDAPNTATLALLSNVQPYYYWSGTDDLVGYVNAWAFAADAGGYHVAANKGYEFFAVAVRDGDVLTPVTEPNAFALALAATSALTIVSLVSKGRLRHQAN